MIKMFDWYLVGLLIAIAFSVFIEHEPYTVLGYFLGGVFSFIEQVISDSR